MLDQAIRRTAQAVTLTPTSPPVVWGEQLDVRPVYVSKELDGVNDQRVAAYVAKYATKSAESAGTVDRRVRHFREIAELRVTEHARRMIITCFSLADIYRQLRLREWAHMLGYSGHFSTKSRHYSITLGSLRMARADYRTEQARLMLGLPAPDPEATTTVSEWRYGGSGHRFGEAFWAQLAHQRITTARRLARLRDQDAA